MEHHGWRRPTPETCKAERLARAGEQEDVPKNQAMLVCKRVAAQIGLKPGALLLLDTFGAFSKPQDWAQGRRPVVWPSNACLMERTGFSLSALKRHLRQLTDAGVIAFRDSPNGNRWGHRNAAGHITEAYGLDLSPLAARAGEFRELFEKLRTEQRLCQRLRRQITVLRRSIRALLSCEPELPDGIAGSFDLLLSMLPDKSAKSDLLFTVCHRLAQFKEAAEAVLGNPSQTVDTYPETGVEAATICQFPNPMGPGNEPHIPTTDKHSDNFCNDPEPAEMPLTKPDQQTLRPETTRTAPDPVNTTRPMGLTAVTAACPAFAQMARDLMLGMKSWPELHRVAGKVGPMLGIQAPVWEDTQRILGPRDAVLAIALVFEKFSAGEVSSPGGYLRGMLRKARSGDLWLERSLHGRLAMKRA